MTIVNLTLLYGFLKVAKRINPKSAHEKFWNEKFWHEKFMKMDVKQTLW